MITQVNDPVKRLAAVQSLLAQVKAEIASIRWNTKQCDDVRLGEHLIALEQHISNAVGRCSTLASVASKLQAADASPSVLWTFNFIGGGFNSCFATSKAVAIASARALFPSLTIDEKSFVARRTKADEDAYYAAIPLMD